MSKLPVIYAVIRDGVLDHATFHEDIADVQGTGVSPAEYRHVIHRKDCEFHTSSCKIARPIDGSGYCWQGETATSPPGPEPIV